MFFYCQEISSHVSTDKNFIKVIFHFRIFTFEYFHLFVHFIYVAVVFAKIWTLLRRWITRWMTKKPLSFYVLTDFGFSTIPALAKSFYSSTIRFFPQFKSSLGTSKDVNNRDYAFILWLKQFAFTHFQNFFWKLLDILVFSKHAWYYKDYIFTLFRYDFIHVELTFGTTA